MATIGEQIIAARKRKGMTQDALAKALNVSRSAIAHWEGDRRLPDAAMLLKLSQILDYSFEDATAKPREDVPSDSAAAAAQPRRRVRRVALLAGAAMLVIALGILLAIAPWRGKPAETPSESNGAPYPVKFFQQIAPNEAGKAYLKLTATIDVQQGSGRKYQMYTFRMTEMNGIGFTIDSVEVCAYADDAYHSEIYTDKDMIQYGNNPEIEPFGSFDFTGGFPVDAFNSVGVVVRGKDANGAVLSFTGHISF